MKKLRMNPSQNPARDSAKPSPDKDASVKYHDPLRYLGLADLAMLAFTCIACHGVVTGVIYLPMAGAITLLVATTVFALTAYSRKLYQYGRMENSIRQFMPFTFTFVQTMLVTSALLFFLPRTFLGVHLWVLMWFATALTGMVAFRLAFWLALDRQRRIALYARKIILVGAGEKSETMVRHFAQQQDLYQVVGLFLTEEDSFLKTMNLHESKIFDHIPLMASVEELERFCRDQHVDDIIITPGLEANPHAESILKTLENLPCSIKYCIPGNFFSRPLADIELISHMPVVTIFHTPLRGTSLTIKRAEDIILSLIAIALCSPVMLVAAMLVALDGQGQIIFRQKRHGFGGHEFDIFKFRSMSITASRDTNVLQAAQGDMRVTWIGKYLRKFSIDELPQLFNVLKGDMSMVGPRPHAVVHNYHYRELINGYVARQRMKPGITGWAQINGWRGQTDTLEKMRKRVEHDLYYVENWSLWFDIKILILTALTFLRHENAY